MIYGDLGKRFLALLIDEFILGLFAALLYYIAVRIGTYPGLVIVSIIITLTGNQYGIILEASSWHATIGKKIMGLYVSDSVGNGINLSQSFLRYLGKLLTGFTFGIGYIICFFNPEKQCLHDRLAKSFVVEGDAQTIGSGPMLRCVSGPLAGTKYTVTESGLLIGRDSVSCQVVMPTSQKNISRIHCFVTYNPISDVFVVNDRNSTYGTFTENGRKINYSQPHALQRGERFYLATRDNMFEVG